MRLSCLFSCLLLALISGSLGLESHFVVHGSWSPWSKFKTACYKDPNSTEIVNCGGGVRKRHRSCTLPTPQGGGDYCQGPADDYGPCNTHACQLPGNLLWSPWSRCTKKCGRGTRKRHTLCGSVRQKIANPTNESPQGNLSDIELEYASDCVDNQYNETTESCNTWNKRLCPSACQGMRCPKFALCIDTSTDEDPSFTCECKLGTVLKSDGSECIEPPPMRPTPRPHPTLAPEVKVVTNVLTRTASTLIIICLSITLILFVVMGIFNAGRVIHMNIEIALLLAHVCLLPQEYAGPDSGLITENCRWISILLQLFFTSSVFFMFLESLHVYAIVTWVVRRDGLLTGLQNTLVGWGCSLIVVVANMCFEYDHYGGEYHCWLQMDKGLVFGQMIPIILFAVVTLAIVEAASGNQKLYKPLTTSDNKAINEQRVSARIMQTGLLLILPVTLASFITGTLAEYEQNLYLYSIFTFLNGVLGVAVLILHSAANERLRRSLVKAKSACCACF